MSQTSIEPNNSVKDYPDYKDQESHKKFYKRRKAVASWQAEQLKKGALVVVLKTNQLLLNELKKRNQRDLVFKKSLELYIENKNLMFGFIDGYKFSKIYFVYSNSVDSLRKGLRNGIFLDTNLKVNPNIVMNEEYYLLLQGGSFVANSTIGFVKEDTAKYVTEHGISKPCDCYALSNKYGHQVYAPMPYITTAVNYGFAWSHFKRFQFNYKIKETPNGKEFEYYVDKRYLEKQKEYKEKGINPPKLKSSETLGIIKVQKLKMYEWVIFAAQDLTEKLEQLSEKYPFDSRLLTDEDIKYFLY